jgi:hypothetical protein
MGNCAAITASGGACRGIPLQANDYCFAHHPDSKTIQRRADKRGGKLGGRGRPHSELEHVKSEFFRIFGELEAGSLDKGVGAVLIQALNGVRRCIEDQRRIREQDEIVERLTELEHRYQENGVSRKWG